MVAVLSLMNLRQRDLQEWDESRNGVNAFEMLQNGDYINYYYNNQLDTWNAKPPLMIWLIAFSYKVFGFNEFGLRFPAFISTFLFFIFCFKIVEKLGNRLKAFYSCLVLLSCKAVLGNHIGLTGDFDSLLLVLLTASVYYFILYAEYQKKSSIFIAAGLTGLAFYTKGTASFIFLPGFISYLLIQGKGMDMLKDRRIWFSLLLFLLIAGSWIILVYAFGKTSTNSFYGTKNSIETMLVHDTFNRLTSNSFEQNEGHDIFFFFKVLDTRLNLWNYLFYISLIPGLYSLAKCRKNLLFCIQDEKNRLVLLSVCMILPLAIVMTFAINQHNWYLAPIFMFVAILTVEGILYLCNKWKYFWLIISILFAFTFIRHTIYLYDLPQTIHKNLFANKSLQGRTILIADDLKQNVFLYLKWLNTRIERVPIEEVRGYKGEFIILNKSRINTLLLQYIEPVSYFDDYCLGLIKK
jgi:4-amino-4-deoxy-L-arabinose transferase-like glycosyltransferase